MQAATILVVDDDADLRELVSTILGTHGFGVRTAASAEEALRELERERPTAMLVDVLMPGVDGIELARRVRARDGLSPLPIVFLTSLGDEGTQERAAQAGGNDFLTKPFSTWELVARVRALIAATRLRQEVESCYRSMTDQMDGLARARQHQKTLTELAAHDMRNPVTAIVLGAENALASLDAEPQEARKSLEDIRASAKSLRAMLSDLLDANLVVDEGLSLTLAPLDVAELIADVARMFVPRAAATGMKLEAITGGELGRPNLDRGLITRTLANLVDNALRFGPSGTTVELRARVEDRVLLLEVVDHGPGVPPELREAIFRKYESVDAESATRRGLGLVFCRLAAREHGGDVCVLDAPGGGTCFQVRLPLHGA